MSRIIAVANQKGGVGKTTTCVNLAASIATAQHRVLMVDLDPQGNATMGCGVDKYTLDRSVCDVLLGDCDVSAAIVKAEDADLDVLPANSDLTVAEVKLLDKLAREQRLKKALQQVASRYDYILIDCPPSLNILTLNALVAADGVLIPIQCEYYALEGLSALLRTIEDVRSTVNESLVVEGLLRTMYDGRNKLGNEVSRQLTDHFGDKVYRTIIPRNIRLAEAPSHGSPALQYDKASRGAVSYLALAGELLRREKHAKMKDETNVA